MTVASQLGFARGGSGGRGGNGGWGGNGDPKADLEKLDGVRVFNPQGKAIGHISLPERCPNLCFGGREGNRLLMASSHSIYSLFVNTRGTGFAV